MLNDEKLIVSLSCLMKSHTKHHVPALLSLAMLVESIGYVTHEKIVI